MWKYYGMLFVAVLLFSVQFVFTKLYQKQRGNGLFAGTLMGVIACVFFIPYYLILNGGRLEFTRVSVLLSALHAVSITLCTLFGLKVLVVANLSAYSMFLMLGGMLVPFTYGLFIGEKLTVFKAVSVFLVLGSLLLTLKKDEKSKTLALYSILFYAIIFLTNGFCSVLAFVHQNSAMETVSTSGFLLLCNLWRLLLSGLILLFFFIIQARKKSEPQVLQQASLDKKGSVKSCAISIGAVLGYGVCHGTAQLLSVSSARFLEAGLHSTIITGGCIFATAVFGTLLFKEKATKKSVLSLIFALAGVVFMMI